MIKFYAKDQLNLAAQDDGDDDDYFLQQQMFEAEPRFGKMTKEYTNVKEK